MKILPLSSLSLKFITDMEKQVSGRNCLLVLRESCGWVLERLSLTSYTHSSDSWRTGGRGTLLRLSSVILEILIRILRFEMAMTSFFLAVLASGPKRHKMKRQQTHEHSILRDMCQALEPYLCSVTFPVHIKGSTWSDSSATYLPGGSFLRASLSTLYRRLFRYESYVNKQNKVPTLMN